MRSFGQLRKHPEAEPIELDVPRVDVEGRTAEAERRLAALRVTISEQRDAARELIWALSHALADMDAAWGDFDERLGGAGDRAGTETIAL